MFRKLSYCKSSMRRSWQVGIPAQCSFTYQGATDCRFLSDMSGGFCRDEQWYVIKINLGKLSGRCHVGDPRPLKNFLQCLNMAVWVKYLALLYEKVCWFLKGQDPT